ncbi:receptor-like protein EIX1 [Neltuma alba]|uniref:receptor-like protein EIX1 n=1 Tax=Neltuma alba TaxID=207710 RepID=UPI0010A35085|nr:receptor-like protein EIX1 [Prosopis alba]
MGIMWMGFLKLLVLAMIVFEVWRAMGADEVQCIEKEREALLRFKAAHGNDSSLVRWSSWGSKQHKTDCCEWEGVFCNNQTGHVIKLHLPADFPSFPLKGEIDASLVELQYLMYLNLSFNNFEDSSIPEFLASLTHLRYLDLHYCGLSGAIPHQLGNLSQLRYLDLSGNYHLGGAIPRQLGNLVHLQHVDLSGNNFTGSIPHQLGNLSQLRYLDLSGNYYLGGAIPRQLGNLVHLQHVNLSGNNFTGSIPHQLGNFSQLRYLDLSGNYYLGGAIPRQLGNLVRLQHVDLSSNNFTGSIPHQLGNLSQLQYLDLSYNSLSGVIPYQLGNLSHLKYLDLSHNTLSGVIPYQLGNLSNLQNLLLRFAGTLQIDRENGAARHEWLSSLTSLTLLELGNVIDPEYCHKWLQMIAKLPNLKELTIVYNDFSDECILSLPSLKFNSTSSLSKLDFTGNNFKSSAVFHWILNISTNLLDLSLPSNHLKGPIPYEFASTLNSLENLDLSRNEITGTLVNLSTCPSLKNLDISRNSLNGTIPKDYQFPSSLVSLDISFNSLKGILTNSNLANLHNMKLLDLSDNSLTLRFSHDWVPPFQLQAIHVRSCKLGPDFPKWLQTQNNFTELDISNNGISGTIPEWFWGLLTPQLRYLNVSCNNISGTLPNLAIEFGELTIISLASNHFEGSLPKFLQNAMALFVSNNSFSKLHTFLCANMSSKTLEILDLSDNQLYGQLSNCWSPFKSLKFLDLSNNNFSGELPISVGSLQHLEVLILRNNGFTGELLINLSNCSNLVVLDAAENKFSGYIPSQIGNNDGLQNLRILILRNNNISGSLSTHLCYLSTLQFLDLSLNILFGQIPKCFKKFTQMALDSAHYSDGVSLGGFSLSYGKVYFDIDPIAMLMWKHQERIFKHSTLVRGFDLSSNKLSGKIPRELGMLDGLISLNLSRNQLDGEIPSEIGRLTSLESLDLSKNHLSGSIPSSFAQLNYLAVLDLSSNNLSGKIPTSTQLQSFDNSSYEENLGLCGEPLETKCPGEEEPQESVKLQENTDSILSKEFYCSMGFGFVVGFWGIFGPILFNRSWRHAYFKFLNNLTDSIYVMVVMKVTKCNRWLRGETTVNIFKLKSGATCRAGDMMG